MLAAKQRGLWASRLLPLLSSAAQSPSPPLDSDLSFQDPKECLECKGARQPLGSRGQRRGCLCASKPDPSLERSLPELQSPILPHSPGVAGSPLSTESPVSMACSHFNNSFGKENTSPPRSTLTVVEPTGHKAPRHSLE